MKNKPIIILILSIFILIVPTVIYLCFLVPCLSKEYNILMSSAGIIGGSGFYGTSKIPSGIKFSSLLKLACNSFNIFVIVLLVQKFIPQIIGLAATVVISFIVFKILLEVYKNAKRDKKSKQIAEEVARNIVESTK